jgi:O-antigen ligase
MMIDPFELAWVAILGGCAALAVAAGAYARPRPALVASYLLLPIAGTKFRWRSPGDALSGEVDWQVGLELALYSLIALIVLMSAIGAQNRRRHLVPAELLLVGFAVLAVTSTFWSTAPSLTFARAFQLTTVCGLALTSVRILGPVHAIRRASVAFVAYVLGCAAIAALIGWDAGYDEKTFRFTWFAVHPLAAGSAAAVASLLVLGKGLYNEQHRSNRQWRLVSWSVLLCLLVVLVLTNSRGPLLAFLAAAGLVMWKATRARFARAMVATTIVFVLIAAVFGESMSTLMMDAQRGDSFVAQRIFRGGNVESLRGLNGRVEVWEVAVPLIAEQPVFGYGYHGSRAVLSQRIPWASYAHSAYVQSLLDFGLFGAFLIWGVFGAAFAALVSRPFGAVTGTAWCDASLTGVAAYLLIVSISSEGFIAVPGFEALLVFMLVSVVGQCSLPVLRGLRRRQAYRPSWPSAARPFRWSPAASRSGPHQ